MQGDIFGCLTSLNRTTLFFILEVRGATQREERKIGELCKNHKQKEFQEEKRVLAITTRRSSGRVFAILLINYLQTIIRIQEVHLGWGGV
ncbi:hypothetical protein K1719_012744 [Acacia pycnantha]|nr:hypothetical protein K1719_012744 [Acacia pycnantha]